MKPILEQTMVRIDNLEEASHKDANIQLDSLKMELRSILRPEQIDKLDDYLSFKGKPTEEKNDKKKRKHL